MKKFTITSLALLLSGCSHLTQQPSQQWHYQCGTLPLTVNYDAQGDKVNFLLDGQQLQLTRVAAASGSKYSDGNYVFWSKGNNALIQRNEQVIANDCVLMDSAVTPTATP